MAAGKSNERILIVAPAGQDAAALAELLNSMGFHAEICDGCIEACRQIKEAAGALLLTEEALAAPHVSDLLGLLEAQPPWSELPIIVLTSGGESRLAKRLRRAVTVASSVALLEQPVGAATLLHSIQVALR